MSGASDPPWSATDSEFATSYAYLQQVVGVIALTLPFVLILGNRLFGGELKGSISAYYYTHMGSYFVGSLFALGVFFVSYQHRPLPDYAWDNRFANLAGIMAIAVALFPVASNPGNASAGSKTVAVFHLACAATLFALLGTFALVFFTKSGEPNLMSKQKQQRNLVYRVCGSTIFAAIALIVVTEIIHAASALAHVLVPRDDHGCGIRHLVAHQGWLPPPARGPLKLRSATSDGDLRGAKSHRRRAGSPLGSRLRIVRGHHSTLIEGDAPGSGWYHGSRVGASP